MYFIQGGRDHWAVNDTGILMYIKLSPIAYCQKKVKQGRKYNTICF